MADEAGVGVAAWLHYGLSCSSCVEHIDSEIPVSPLRLIGRLQDLAGRGKAEDSRIENAVQHLPGVTLEVLDDELTRNQTVPRPATYLA